MHEAVGIGKKQGLQLPAIVDPAIRDGSGGELKAFRRTCGDAGR